MTLTAAKCRHQRIDLRSAAGRFSDHHGIATHPDLGIADTPCHRPLSPMRDRAVSKLSLERLDCADQRRNSRIMLRPSRAAMVG